MHFLRRYLIMLDQQDEWESLSRRYVAEALQRLQENGLQRLEIASLPEERALYGMERIQSVCFNAHMLFDDTYAAFEAENRRAGRSPHHQRWLEDRTAYLLQQVELGVDQIVRGTIQQTIQEMKNPPPPPRPKEVVREIIVEPRPPAWQRFLRSAAEGLGLVVGFAIWGVLCLFAFVSLGLGWGVVFSLLFVGWLVGWFVSWWLGKSLLLILAFVFLVWLVVWLG
jgi:hypothetical protein